MSPLSEVGSPAQPRIADFVTRGFSLFGKLHSSLETETSTKVSAPAIAASHFARFKLWTGSIGAHRPSGSRSIEYRLRDASSIRNHIISLLQDLCQSLDEALTEVTRAQEDRPIPSLLAHSEDSDTTEAELEDYFRGSADPDDAGSDISPILADIGHTIDCLLRLSITIQNPAPHDHFASRSGLIIIAAYEEWDIRHIQEKHPHVDSWIAERLGKATARRRQYFRYREEHAIKLSQGLEASAGDERDERDERDENDEREKATTIASSIPQHLKESQVTENPDLTDLDDNLSAVSKTSYALSTADSGELRVPPIPKEHEDGPFNCPFCHMIVSISNRRDWKYDMEITLLRFPKENILTTSSRLGSIYSEISALMCASTKNVRRRSNSIFVEEIGSAI